MLLGMVAAKVGKMTPRPCKALDCKFLTQPVTVRADYDLVLKAYVRLLAAYEQRRWQEHFVLSVYELMKTLDTV